MKIATFHVEITVNIKSISETSFGPKRITRNAFSLDYRLYCNIREHIGVSSSIDALRLYITSFELHLKHVSVGSFIKLLHYSGSERGLTAKYYVHIT